MKTKKDLQSAKNTCYRLLKVRARSENELRDRLRQKGFDGAIIEQAIDELRELKLIDDGAFARLWVESRIDRPMGSYRLIAELQKKGVRKDLIAAAIAAYNSPEKEEEAIRHLLEIKKKKLKGLDKKKMKERLWGFFLRKGFSREIVFDILSEL